MARLIQVIETSEVRGAGIPGNPMRRVTQYFATDGTLLAEVDPEASRQPDPGCQHMHQGNSGQGTPYCLNCGAIL